MDWVKFIVSAVIGLVSFSIPVKYNEYSFLCFDLMVTLALCSSFFSRFILQITVIGSLSNPKADIRVILAILTSVVGYCVKTYFTLSVFFFIILAILVVIQNLYPFRISTKKAFRIAMIGIYLEFLPIMLIDLTLQWDFLRQRRKIEEWLGWSTD